MKKICKELQRRLLDDGPGSLRDDEAAQQHLIECDDCFELLESVAVLEASLAEMEVVDAPDSWVDELLASPEIAAGSSTTETPTAFSGPSVWSERWHRLAGAQARRPLVWGSFAAAAMAVVVIGLLSRGGMRSPSYDRASYTDEIAQTAAVSVVGAEDYREVPEAQSDVLYAAEPVLDAVGKAKGKGELGRQAGGPMPDGSLASPQEEPPASGAGRPSSVVVGGERLAFDPDAPRTVSESLVGSKADEELRRARKSQLPLSDLRSDAPRPNAPASISSQFAQNKQRAVEQAAKQAVERSEEKEGDEVAGLAGGDQSRDFKADKNAAMDDDGLLGKLGAFEMDNERLEVGGHAYWQDEAEFGKRPARHRAGESPADGQYRKLDVYRPDIEVATQEVANLQTTGAAARAFLDERARMTDLVFRDATGYWANTYVPGDPALRLLHMRLESRQPSIADPTIALTLHDAARQTRQPFDPPDNAALALYLNADQRGLSGPQRMLVQVGLKATERRGGRRPAMNVGVVLDLRGEVPADVGAAMRALVGAFNQARDRSDRFCLVVAGRGGESVVEPSSFRHGPLTLALERHLDASSPGGAPSLDLPSALRRAVDLVTVAEDPGAPLGTSAVVVVTGQALGSGTATLADLSHQAAVAGVPVSVVGVGGSVDLAELDRLVLAGQGSRRLLQAPAGAEALVERELEAVSRIVARAVRLRIRLAKGVRLVDVIGSHRLDEAGAQRVRAAEQAIDQRLARDLGIVADRGEDEEGIQIVIPGFYAGDEHAILLDVVVTDPSSSSIPIADATVRFKDLVYPGNGVTRANLSVERGDRVAGPLERNVLKNYLAYRLYEVLEAAGEAVGAGDPVLAVQLVVAFHGLLAELSAAVPGLDRDVELAADMSILADYLELLQAGTGVVPGDLEALSDSMRYAARLKILPRPVLGDGSG